MKNFLEKISLPVLIICFIGVLLKRIIPFDFHYIFGFIVGTVSSTVNTVILFKKDRK